MLWIGTSRGASRSSDAGRIWESFADEQAFARPGIFSLAIEQDTIWCSTGYVQDVNGSNVQTGSGYAYSIDNGTNWLSVGQPIDDRGDTVVQYGANIVRFLPVIVPEQNVTFDIALTSGTVWVASWASGLRRSTDRGLTWQRTVLPNASRNSIAPEDSLDGYYVDPRNDNNFLAFSVLAENDSVIWAGTAGGINRSSDGGQSWRKYTTANQSAPILGDWVIALAVQERPTGVRVWATNWPADGPNQRFGVSYTDDAGESWRTFLEGIRAYAFAFHDSIAYVASVDGIYRTDDGGASWIRSGSIVDPQSGATYASSTFLFDWSSRRYRLCGGRRRSCRDDRRSWRAIWLLLESHARIAATHGGGRDLRLSESFLTPLRRHAHPLSASRWVLDGHRRGL